MIKKVVRIGTVFRVEVDIEKRLEEFHADLRNGIAEVQAKGLVAEVQCNSCSDGSHIYDTALILGREKEKTQRMEDGICKWTYDEDYDCWETECGFEYCVGSLELNDYYHCPQCGRQIVEGDEDE